MSCKYCESDSISVYTGEFAGLIINPEIQTCLFIHLAFDNGFVWKHKLSGKMYYLINGADVIIDQLGEDKAGLSESTQ